MRLVLFGLLFLGVVAVQGALNGVVSGVPFLGLPVGLLLAWLALVVYRRTVGAVERREVVELAPEGARRGLRKGTVVGVGLFTATIALMAVFGEYGIAGWGSVGGALTLVGAMASAAVAEELLFRGVVFRLVEDVAGTWGALALSSVLFGALHLVNPGATAWGAVAIAIEAGTMLGAAYAATRSLWLPIGLHFGWNVAESALFGTAVSGSSPQDGLLRSVLTGPDALTGDAFGPEASLFAVLVCGGAAVALLRVAKRRGNLRGRRSQQSRAARTECAQQAG